MQKNMVNYADYSIQEIGSYLIHQNDILDSVDVLQSILDDTQGQLDQTFFSRLYLYFNSIRDRVIRDWDRSRGYIILEGPDSIALHLYTIWPVVNNKKECIDHLQYEIKRIYEDYRKPSGDISYGLTLDEIEELMQHVQDKFLYSTILLSDTPLMICFIKCIHAKSNALYSYTRKVGGSIEDLLLLPYKNQMSCFPQKFIYLHELGHLLHFRTTHNIRQLPATFYTLLEHWKTSRPMLNVEVFADFFAIAALYDPSLENDTIPYQLEAEAKNIILAYYILLFCQKKTEIILSQQIL